MGVYEKKSRGSLTNLFAILIFELMIFEVVGNLMMKNGVRRSTSFQVLCKSRIIDFAMLFANSEILIITWQSTYCPKEVPLV